MLQSVSKAWLDSTLLSDTLESCQVLPSSFRVDSAVNQAQPPEFCQQHYLWAWCGQVSMQSHRKFKTKPARPVRSMNHMISLIEVKQWLIYMYVTRRSAERTPTLFNRCNHCMYVTALTDWLGPFPHHTYLPMSIITQSGCNVHSRGNSQDVDEAITLFREALALA
jgi:hypothetical protein